MYRYSQLLSAGLLLALFAGVPGRAEQPRAELVVSPALAGAFTVHENAIHIPDGSEITLLRHLDLKVRQDEMDLKEEPDPRKLGAFWLQVALLRDTRGQPRFALDKEIHLSSVMIRVRLPRKDGGKPARIEKLLTGSASSGPEASRLDALKQLDVVLRDLIGRSLVASVRVTEKKTHLRFLLRNPYQVPVAGLLYMRNDGVKPRDRDIALRLDPGQEQVRLVPFMDPYERSDPKNAYGTGEIINSFYVFPRLVLNAPPER